MKLFSRKNLLVSSLLFSSFSFGQALLPIDVTQSIYNSDAFTLKDKTSWGEYGLTSGDGWGVADIHFEGVPGSISLDFSRNKYGKNHSIQVLQSSDGVNWQENKIVNEGGSTSWKSVKSVLKKDTRHIRFYYEAAYKFGDIWAKFAYWRNISIRKSVLCKEKEIKLYLAPEAIADTSFTLAYSYPESNIQISSTDNKITLLTNNADTSLEKEGEALIGFSVKNEITEDAKRTYIYSNDSGYEGNADSTEIVVYSDVKLAGEVVSKPNSILINWAPLKGIKDYRVEILKDNIVITDTTIYNQTSLEAKSLKPSSEYSFRIQPLTETGAYPFSDKFDVVTGALPAFEEVVYEFINGLLKFIWSVPGEETYRTTAVLKHLKTDTVIAEQIEEEKQEFVVENLLHGTIYNLNLKLHTPYHEPVIYTENFTTPVPAVTLQEATNLTDNSFTVHWEHLGENIRYVFSLFKDGIPAEGYETIETTDPLIHLKGLEAEQTYTYEVKAISDENIESPVSSGTATTEMTVGTEEIENDGRIYRHQNQICIKALTSQPFVRIYDLKGKLIYSNLFTDSVMTISIHTTEPVIVKLTDGNQIITAKL